MKYRKKQKSRLLYSRTINESLRGICALDSVKNSLKVFKNKY